MHKQYEQAPEIHMKCQNKSLKLRSIYASNKILIKYETNYCTVFLKGRI